MSERHASQTTAQHLLQWLGETVHVAHPPVPLVGRLASLIGDQPIVFKDSDMSANLGVYSGRIAVFTETHVFLQTASTQVPNAQGFVMGNVVIQVAARKDLRSLRHAGPVDLGDRYGRQPEWQWPWAVMVELTYNDDLHFSVPLDGKQWRGGFSDDFLPELLADLAM